MLKIYINGSTLSSIEYLNTIWLTSVSPVITNGKSKAPAGGNFNFKMSILFRSVEAHSGCIQVSQFIIKGAWMVWLVHSLKSNFKYLSLCEINYTLGSLLSWEGKEELSSSECIKASPCITEYKHKVK